MGSECKEYALLLYVRQRGGDLFSGVLGRVTAAANKWVTCIFILCYSF